jgi:hypothetical protein
MTSERDDQTPVDTDPAWFVLGGGAVLTGLGIFFACTLGGSSWITWLVGAGALVYFVAFVVGHRGFQRVLAWPLAAISFLANFP